MSDNIKDCGGAVLDLQGGSYLLSSPLVVPQYWGNLRIIDGTLRAAPSFPAGSYVIQVGAGGCNPPSGQGSCNENVGMSGLTLDASHVAAGCLLITATMGATLDASSACFGFTQIGIHIAGGHETMVSETWVAAYFWDSPSKETNSATGVLIAGNDHFLTNVICFSSKIGVRLTGAANLLTNVHTWNAATGYGGVGIQNEMSQNRFGASYYLRQPESLRASDSRPVHSAYSWVLPRFQQPASYKRRADCFQRRLLPGQCASSLW